MEKIPGCQCPMCCSPANATAVVSAARFETLPKQPPPLPPVITFTLTVDAAHAETLRALLGMIGGGGPLRKQTNTMYDALEQAGVGRLLPNPFASIWLEKGVRP